MARLQALALIAGCLSAACTQATFEPVAAPSGTLAPLLVARRSGPELLALRNDAAQHTLVRTSVGSTTCNELARGDSWFVNWADVPAAVEDEQGQLWFSWLVATGEQTYDYAAWLGRVDATGKRPVSLPEQRLHEDAGAGEHGFVSLAARPQAGIAMAWLDGRAYNEGKGATRVYVRFADNDGTLGPEWLVDDRACDCCPTSLTMVGSDALVAWRDRGPDERRDIALATVSPEGVVTPVQAHTQDGWIINGCPVNGAALASHGERVALVRYTEGGETGAARVLLATADTLDGPWHHRELVAAGAVGRVDVSSGPDGTLSVVWLERTAEAAQWRLARWRHFDARQAPVTQVDLITTTPSRASGRARVLDLGTEVLVAIPAPEGAQVLRWQP